MASSGQKRCLFWFMEIDPVKQNLRNLIKLFVYFENHERRTLGDAHKNTDSLNVTFTLSAPDQRQISNIFFIKSMIRLYIVSLYCHFILSVLLNYSLIISKTVLSESSVINTAQKVKFSIKNFLNATKSAGNCEFGHIY